MDRSFEQKTGSPAEAEHSKWTLAVDLSVDLRDDKRHVTGAGSFDHWQQIKSIAEKTAQAPVSVVVTVPRLDTLATDAADFKQRLEQPKDFGTGGQLQATHGPMVDTYLVSGGKIQYVEGHFSTGLSSDIESLLKTAQKVAPSEHLGLSIMAHGWGTESGLRSDSSTASTEQLHDAIKNGLGTRGRLDVLDFDACKMASTDTASRMKDVTKYMVASADDEAASLTAKFDGQNIAAAVSGLIAHPEKTAQQFANDLVAQADAGANGKPTKIPEVPNQLRSGTDTLIAIDMDRYKQFEQNLNALARVLQPHLDNKVDRAAIGKAIDATPSFPSHVPFAQNELRDTKQFAQKIIGQIKDGKLTDDGSIRTAAENLLASQKAMTERLHKNPNLYGDIGGISTFLPVTSPQSRRDMVASHFGIKVALADIPMWQKLYENRNALEQNAQFALGVTASGLSESDRAKMSGLTDSYIKVLQCRNQAEYGRAVDQMQAEARKFMKTPLADRIITQFQSTVHPSDGDPTRSEWTSFVDDLITRSQASY